MCLKTLLDTNSWICPCCQSPIGSKFGDLCRPRVIVNLMTIYKKGETDLNSEKLKMIYESAREKENKNMVVKARTRYVPGLSFLIGLIMTEKEVVAFTT